VLVEMKLKITMNCLKQQLWIENSNEIFMEKKKLKQ
jgi:hypothetical protein